MKIIACLEQKMNYACSILGSHFARSSELSYLYSCIGCIACKPARKKLFWLLCNNAKAGKSLAKTNKKVGKRGVRGWSLCFCFFWLYESSSWSCKKRVKSTAQQQSTEQRSCSPLRDEIRKKNRITKRHLRHFLPLFSPLNLPTKNSGICLGY